VTGATLSTLAWLQHKEEGTKRGRGAARHPRAAWQAPQRLPALPPRSAPRPAQSPLAPARALLA